MKRGAATDRFRVGDLIRWAPSSTTTHYGTIVRKERGHLRIRVGAYAFWVPCSWRAVDARKVSRAYTCAACDRSGPHCRCPAEVAA